MISCMGRKRMKSKEVIICFFIWKRLPVMCKFRSPHGIWGLPEIVVYITQRVLSNSLIHNTVHLHEFPVLCRMHITYRCIGSLLRSSNEHFNPEEAGITHMLCCHRDNGGVYHSRGAGGGRV